MANLVTARLVSLSACETGIVDAFGSPEEYVGLPAGFMSAGVPCVVSSLWSVPDFSTALLMGHFYQQHVQNGQDPARALQAAQQWLKDLKVDALIQYVEALSSQASDKDRARFYTVLRHYKYLAAQNAELRPFAHPFYWAAFTVNGL
jgi:CHAT domain-containing protein